METSSNVDIYMWSKEFSFCIMWKQASVFCISLFKHSEMNTVLETVLHLKVPFKNIKNSYLPKSDYTNSFYSPKYFIQSHTEVYAIIQAEYCED